MTRADLAGRLDALRAELNTLCETFIATASAEERGAAEREAEGQFQCLLRTVFNRAGLALLDVEHCCYDPARCQGCKCLVGHCHPRCPIRRKARGKVKP